MDGLYVVAIDFPLQHLAFRVVEVTLLDKSVTFHHYELLELGVMPMLALGDSWFRDINAHLSCIQCMNQLSKRASFIYVHFERESGLLVRQVAEVSAVEFLGKTVGRYLRYHQGFGLVGKGFEQFHYLAQGYLMGDGGCTIAAILFVNGFHTVKLAAVLFALEGTYHLGQQVVNLEQFQFYTGVVDGIWQVVGKGIAKCSNRAIVVRPAPFAKKVRETVNKHLGSRFLTVL